MLDRLEDRTLLTALLDPTFGLGGRATVPFEPADAGGRAAAIQDDGRVVVAGTFGQPGVVGSDFLVARYDTDGALDPTFSGDGIATIAFDLGGADVDMATGVAIDGEGRIVVVGQVDNAAGDIDFGIARLNADGSPDTTFDGDGRTSIGFDVGGSNNDLAADVTFDTSGRILVAGSVDRGGGDTAFGIARLEADGSPDGGFGFFGRRTVNFNLGGPGHERDDARAIAVQPEDNHIVVAGTVEVSPTNRDFGVARLNPDGSYDGTFNAGSPLTGRQTVAFDLGGTGKDKASDLAILPGGDLLVSGTIERAGTERDFGVARLDTDGALVPGFGSPSRPGRAWVSSPLVSPSSDVCNAMAVQDDGAIVLAGRIPSTTGGLDFGVARLTPDGDADLDFSGDGWQTIGFNLGGSNLDSANAVVIQDDGRIVAVGEVFDDFVAIALDPVGLARLNTDGSIDTGYGGLGRVAEPFGFANGLASGMVPLPDGRTIVAGSVIEAGGNLDFAVARVNEDGALDPSFGVGGVAAIPFDLGGSNMDRARAVAVQPTGEIVVVGMVDRGGGNFDFGVARLDEDGNLDGTFNAAGVVPGTRTYTFDVGGDFWDEANAVAIQPTGEIVVGGNVRGGTLTRDFLVIRLNPDSSPDSSFGAGGVRQIGFNLGGDNDDDLSDLAILPDGQILLVGTVDRALGSDFGVARLTAEGDPDFTFNDDGLQVVPFDLGGGNVDRARALAILPDGRILLAGAVTTSIPGDEDFGVARLTADGELDSTFNGDGRQTIGFNLGGTNVDRAFDVTVQDGRILLAGSAERDLGTDFAVARLRADGMPDGTFAPDGRQTVAFDFGGGNADMAVAVAALPSSRVLLMGAAQTDSPEGLPIVTMARLNISPPLEGDYDGDGQTDLATYRYDDAAGSATFDLQLSNFGSTTVDVRTITGVGPRVVPVSGDFDGDGLTDVAVVDPLGDVTPGASTWIILRSGSGDARLEVPFGAIGELDRPAPADFDGDGITDIATFRANSDLTPGAAEWFIRPSADPTAGYRVAFGAANGVDLPAPADFDRDGFADIATFRPVPHPNDFDAYDPEGDGIGAQWFIRPSSDVSAAFRVEFGSPGNFDQPVVSDFNGDGRADITAFRSVSDLVPGVSQWFLLPSAGPSPGFGSGFSVTFGTAGEIAAVGDYDRDGGPDLAVFDRDTGVWTLRSGTSPPDRTETFGPTGQDVVPVLAPLFFRLRATGNLDGSAAFTARRVDPDSAPFDLEPDASGGLIRRGALIDLALEQIDRDLG